MKMLLVAASTIALTLSSGLAVAQQASPAAATKGGPKARKFGAWGFDLAGRNTAAKPSDSFYEYANGAWAKTVQFDADLPQAGVNVDTYKLIQEQLRSVIEDSARSVRTPTAQKVGGLYASFMDEARLEQLDDKPLQADLSAVRAVKNKTDMAYLMGQASNGFGSGLLNLGIGIDAKAPDRYVVSAGIGGMGLPDRDYYVTDKYAAQKAAYLDYIARTLQMVGWTDPQGSARAVLDLETKVADATWTRTERRDPNKTYNPMTFAELKALTPGYDWNAYVRGAGMPAVDRVIVGQNTAFPKVAKIFDDAPLETLKAWEAFHTTRQASPYLSKRFVDNTFAFSKVVSGAQQQRPRWNRGVNVVDGSLGVEACTPTGPGLHSVIRSAHKN